MLISLVRNVRLFMTRLRHFQSKLRRISSGWHRPCRCFLSAEHPFGAVSLAVSPKPHRSVRACQFQARHPQQVVGARYKVADATYPITFKIL
jgi:hypothetical protein